MSFFDRYRVDTDMEEDLDEKKEREERSEKRYKVAVIVRDALYLTGILIVLIVVVYDMLAGPVVEFPEDDRFSNVDTKYSRFPTFSDKPYWKLAVGMSTDDFLHEYGLDALVDQDPEEYPYDMDCCIDLPEQECRVASKDGVIVYISVYNYRMQSNMWNVRYPNEPLFSFGDKELNIDWIRKKFGEPAEEYTVGRDQLRRHEGQNWAIYPITMAGEADGYVVYKYRNSGKVVEIGAGIISAEKIAALPQYSQRTSREISPGMWYIPFDR